MVQRGFGGTLTKRTNKRATSRLIGPIAPSEAMVWTPPDRDGPSLQKAQAQRAKGLGCLRECQRPPYKGTR